MKCPFDDPKFKLPAEVPCPVCGMKADDKNICVNTPTKKIKMKNKLNN